MILHQVECDGVNSQAKKVRNEGEEPRTRTRSCRTDRELRGNGTFYTASGHLVFTWNTCTFIFRHLVRVQSGLSVTWMMMKWFDFFFVARTKMKYFGQNPKPGKRHLIIQKKKVVDYYLLYLYLFSGVPKMSKCNKVHSGSWCGQVQLPPQAPQLVYHCVCVCVIRRRLRLISELRDRGQFWYCLTSGSQCYPDECHLPRPGQFPASV